MIILFFFIIYMSLLYDKIISFIIFCNLTFIIHYKNEDILDLGLHIQFPVNKFICIKITVTS